MLQRTSHWSVQEEMNNKLEWLTSRMIFYSWTRKNEKFKSIESFVQSEHILEDFMRFIPSLRYRFSELYNRWPSWNLDKNEGLVKLVEERVQSCSEDDARDIWKRWASTAKEFGITLDSESIYGEKFLPLYDLNDKKLMKNIEGGKRVARKRNAIIEHHNHCLLGSSVLLEFLLSEHQTDEKKGVSYSILSSFNSTQRQKSKDLFFNIFERFNTGCPRYEDDKNGFTNWTETNERSYYLWKRESSDSLKRSLWNYRYPDDTHLVLFEPNYIEPGERSYSLIVSKPGEKSIYDIL